MFRYILCISFVVFQLFATCVTTRAQKVVEPRTVADWEAPYAPFRIVGNLYYVGTRDLACYLITTTAGNILINTGLGASVASIQKNIETLGFKFLDIKILLTTQAHYDHVGAMADIRQHTGAQLIVHQKEADVLISGGSTDYELGQYGTSFKPVTPDRLLEDSDTVRLGNMSLMLLHHPGHTKGSSSFLLTVKDDQRSYLVFIANMPTIVTSRKLNGIKEYPAIAKDYAYTLNAMKKIKFDIWLASHAGQFNMHSKHTPGDAYGPARFIDQAGYNKALGALQKEYDIKMKTDK
jgi:metallo-beta-lactamase class B